MAPVTETLRRLAERINRLAVAVTGAVLCACLMATYLFWHHHYQNLSRAAEETARRQADLIRLAVEHQMEENERDLIALMVTAFGRDPTIHEVRILDRAGETRFSGGADTERGMKFEPTCAPCHAPQPGPQLTLWDPGPNVFRVVLPIENRPACHRCHEPEESVNGALLVDVRADAIARTVNRDLLWPILVIGGISLALLGAIAISVRVLVLRRLEHFEAAARAIAAGQLERRLPARGGDTLSWMARAFNAMADSVMRLARELREQRELLEMVINSVDDGIAVLDRRYRLVAANEAFLARAPGRTPAIPGANCREVFGASCPEEVCPAQRCFRGAERQSEVLTRALADGSTRLEEVHASPIRSSNEVIAVVEVWRDITDRRVAEARMAEAHRMASLGMLASGFSHEMNTPLATTLTCLDSMLRVLQEIPEEQRDARHQLLLERAQIGREQILRCRGITQQFLRLSRGQAVSTGLVDLAPVARAVARLVEPTAQEKGVTVRCAPALDGQAVVRASDAELQQVVLNLLLNSIQACNSGGEVEVSIQTGPARLVVRDDGCGIPADQLQKIFEPFYGLRPGGTGLGLFLSLSMARSWGADVRVQSKPGQGSSFEVRFEPSLPPRAES